MKTFYIGYLNSEDELLTNFKTSDEADFNAEEWVEVKANTFEEAQLKYENARKAWRDERFISASVTIISCGFCKESISEEPINNEIVCPSCGLINNTSALTNSDL